MLFSPSETAAPATSLFPRRSSPPRSTQTRPTVRPSLHGRGPAILVIDDDDLVRRSVVRALRRKYAVTDVADAESALALIEGGAHFDAILCDLNLTGMSGRQFLYTLEATHPELASRVVILSGSASNDMDEAFTEAIGWRFLEKPASLAAIDGMLGDVVASHARAA